MADVLQQQLEKVDLQAGFLRVEFDNTQQCGVYFIVIIIN